VQGQFCTIVIQTTNTPGVELIVNAATDENRLSPAVGVILTRVSRQRRSPEPGVKKGKTHCLLPEGGGVLLMRKLTVKCEPNRPLHVLRLA
jgi:hypothetical protein